ncbi:CheR family methyltransferase [Sandarakinorhabdus rubra]|uniref:CheR family methyltransferase n=1 Tax=Sandarakinorhabdus rubra TaxID=2672568 RepID=UPI0013DB03DA|nr:CheR family methyltransferase [Sandarakinorhabdus rubra]
MVVAIGGSAGALDAVRGLIAGLPARSGIAYILVQHLDPDHLSMLPALLADATPFPVVEISDGMALQPDRLHVIPAGARVAVTGGVLRLSPATHHEGPRLPIDFLLQSLALEQQLRVVAVLLSGQGADGRDGVRAVHQAGGYVIAQDPLEAGYDSMPAAAIATGCVDAILPVAAMGAAIIDRRNRLPLPLPTTIASDWIAPVLERLKQGGHDFSGYKPGTMQRRIERRARMAAHPGSTGAAALAAYVKRLEQDDEELQALANDLLINVTSFFRDEDVFDTLATRIIPDLVRRHDGNRPIRLWCAGCSSGEEAWSLAMLFLEEIARNRPGLKLQIFATDLDPDAIATARHGVYPHTIEREVSRERLQRFFIADDEGWRVGPILQACVVLAVHDLLTDPPFSRIDLVSCRNLLIYLQPAAQARAIGLFHFALSPGGLLLLGKAETVMESEDGPPAFTLVSRPAHLYRRNASRKPLPPIPLEPGQIWVAEGRPPREPPWPLPSLPSARLQALEAELASIRVELARADSQPDGIDADRLAIHADTVSRNQEYQSANEELITSQEELQSLNEELVALNGQLQETIDRQRTMADDLQNILYSTNVATIFLDLDQHIRFFTPATRVLFHMLPGDIGRPFGDLAPLAPDPQLASDIAAVEAGELPPDREVATPTGICFSRKVLPYRAHDNHVEGVIITYTDVTDRKQAERVMQEARHTAETANLAKSRFLAAASHDLRQPLQSLVLLQELLARKATDEDSRQLLVRQSQTLEAMSAMLDGLLDINRIEADAVEIAQGSFALDPLLAEIVEGLALQATASKLKLRHVRTGCHVVSDRRLLAGMLRNLVANALKYTVKGGVLVGARRRGNTVRIEVWDSGIGIPKDQQRVIFEPYQQLGPAAVDRGSGLGLGLSIVRSLGDMLGHAVEVRSRDGDGQGHGSVFSITVPLAGSEAAAPAGPAIAALPQAPLPGTAARILIIDDEAGVRELLEQLLREAGHEVVAASDDVEALAALAQHTPDLIISDFRLASGRDGLELARALRAAIRQQHDRHVPVIMLTGDISIEALARFAANDIVRLSKPVRAADLDAAIAAALVRPHDDVPPVAGLVHIIDDDPEVLRELGTALGDAGLVVALHGSAEAFRADWAGDRNCCLLIDALLPGESGLDLLSSLQAAGTLPPSIMITGQGDIGMAVAAMKAGALDFIEKPAHGEEIISSVTRALASRADAGQAGTERAAAAARLAPLTARQREVMARVLQGQPSKNIAADLKLSQRTVEHHRAAIMHRTGCKSLPELARLVMIADPGGANR